jgi:hypothetical protein
MRKLILAVFVVAFALTSSAFADEIYQLTVPENSCATMTPPTCIPADTFKVDVDLTSSTTAAVTFTQENSLYGLDNALLSVDVPGGSTLGTSVGSVGTPSIDGYGDFTVSYSPPGHDASSVVFDLTLSGGGTWSSAANVLIQDSSTYNAGEYPGTGGFYAAAQVRISDCTSSSEPGCTGTPGSSTGDNGQLGNTGDTAADLGTVSSAPEPTSVILFGSVLLVAGGAVRKRLAR